MGRLVFVRSNPCGRRAVPEGSFWFTCSQGFESDWYEKMAFCHVTLRSVLDRVPLTPVGKQR